MARIYDFDESMLAFCDQIETDIDALGKAVLDDGDIEASIRMIDVTLREANTAFQGRQEVLAGVA